MSCQETVQTLCYVWGICRQRVDTISTCKCVIIAVSWFQIWSESNLAISSIFATLLIFAVPGVLRNYPSRGGCACCRKQAGCISVNGVTLSHRDASYSNSTRKYLHTCIDCHRSGHSDCSYCGHATPSGIILWIVKVATFVLDLLMVSQKISLSHWQVLTECMVASVTKLSAW